jgi:uncharacterized protein YneF (UPF0154 family)
MIAVVICICIALLSILFLIGWFFNTITQAQKRIDDDSQL